MARFVTDGTSEYNEMQDLLHRYGGPRGTCVLLDTFNFGRIGIVRPFLDIEVDHVSADGAGERLATLGATGKESFSEGVTSSTLRAIAAEARFRLDLMNR